jgi:hypothetical protein
VQHPAEFRDLVERKGKAEGFHVEMQTWQFPMLHARGDPIHSEIGILEESVCVDPCPGWVVKKLERVGDQVLVLAPVVSVDVKDFEVAGDLGQELVNLLLRDPNS